MASIEELLASVMGIAVERVTDDLEYDGIPEWDSLHHVNLILKLEEEYGKEIDEDLMVELTSIQAIRRFIAGEGGP